VVVNNDREKDEEQNSSPFHKRFDTELNLEDAKLGFVNRVQNGIDRDFFWLENYSIGDRDEYRSEQYGNVLEQVANRLGLRYDFNDNFSNYYRGHQDFHQFLRALEELFDAIGRYMPNRQMVLGSIIESAIVESEIDLGIEWRDGKFLPTEKQVHSKSRFSRASIIEALSHLDTLTHAEIDRLLLRYSLEKVAPDSLGSKTARLNTLMEYLITHPHEKGPLGSNLAFELIEQIIGMLYRRFGAVLDGAYPEELVNTLKQDGYTVEEGKLKSSLPGDVQLVEQANQLDLLLSKYDFDTAKGHLEQARNAHARGEWAAANAQLRSFTESLFDSIAEKLAGINASLPASSYQKREFLARMNPPFLFTNLNEWDLSGKGGFIQGLLNRLHPQGSHPGLSDEEDSTFRLHIVLLAASHYLKRFDRRISI
jgi:hypothetical protein